MKTRKSQIEAVARYDRENTLRFSVKLNRKTDADLIELIERSGNRNALVKEALRAYCDHESDHGGRPDA